MYGVTPYTSAAAVLSPCRRFRYTLTRTWDTSLPTLGFVGLNPSTGDEDVDDPTLRKEMGFARRLGCGSIHKVNLFGWRATDPKELLARYRAHLNIGSHDGANSSGASANVNAFIGLLSNPRVLTIIAAWGCNSIVKKTKEDAFYEELITRARPLYALRLTKDGIPEHTLYLPYMRLEDGIEVPRTPIVYREKRT